MRKDNPNIDYNIYKALDNVNLNCVIGTKNDGEYESFLANYDNKSSKQLGFFMPCFLTLIGVYVILVGIQGGKQV